MLYISIVVQVILAFVIIFLILLQKGRGAEMGVSFGAGAAETMFGARGALPFLTKVTWVLVFIFMANSVSISLIFYKSKTKTIMKKTETEKAVPQKPQKPLPELPIKTP
jgi:preprotein translocase subunit SecG